MDAKDFRLLVALDADARQSLRALGRRVSLTAPAVRERLRRLEERGILQGYWVSIDPAIFGRKDLLAYFGGEWTRDAAMGALDAPDVAWVAWKVDGGLTVQVWPRRADESIAAVSRFLKREPLWRGAANSDWGGALNGLDWRVLDALIDDPRAPVERLSDATGLSPKTVRSHLASMIRSEAISVAPRLGFLTDTGGLVCHLLVSGAVAISEVRRAFGDAVFIHETHDPPRKYLFCRTDSLGELTARTQALEKRPGVTSVQITLNRELIIGTRLAHRLTRERIDAWENVHREPTASTEV